MEENRPWPALNTKLASVASLVPYARNARTHSAKQVKQLAASIREWGFTQIIWAKERLVLSRGDYHWQHEPCWYAVRKGRTASWQGDRSQSTVWPVVHSVSETGHPTQKPVECMRRPIENNSQPGDAVYEPFSGSGTTIIAAEMAARRCFAIELSPTYVDIAVRRWQAFTGNHAMLDGTGQSFEEVSRERLISAV